jgi:SpoVK/Ycf46/Vps4 family AAA+-type ATPase
MTTTRRRRRNQIEQESAGSSTFAALSASLCALDAVLTVAVDRQARLLGPASLLDPWRGMHLEHADVQRLVSDSARAGFFCPNDASVPGLLATQLLACPRIAATLEGLGLTDIDLAVVVIVLAPDLDLRYQRIFAYLQDDIARKRPTSDLIANLLARDTGERLAVLCRFAAMAPLMRSGLIASQGDADTPVLARGWCIDELWRKYLIDDHDIGAELGRAACLLTVADRGVDRLPLDPDTRALLAHAVTAAATGPAPLRVLLHGPHGSGKFELAQAVACDLSRKLLVLDLRDCAGAGEVRALLGKAARAADLFSAVLYVHGFPRLADRDPQILRAMVDTLAGIGSHLMLSAIAPLPVQATALQLLRVELGTPAAPARRVLWDEALAERALAVDAPVRARIASRFSLNAAQIRQAAADAQTLALSTGARAVGYAELSAAARQQCGTELARMAQRVTPRADFSVLVVPAEVRAQLREICIRVATRDEFGRDWAIGCVHARTTGVTALFVGPSGTGKTLSAEAVATELGLDLYRIDLAGIVSKYIGETEKNLDRVFAAAENANAVLFFDEADALFGKRSEVKDAHDRYANIEIAYLLQKMEQFDGLAVLATNLKQNLDEAFARRLTFTVTFPFPEEPERRKLWEQLWPPRAPRAEDIDLAWFAREFRLSGGNIRNAVMAAAHLAAADGKMVTHDHLMHATRREFQKLGKNLVHSVAGGRAAG